MSRGGSGAVSYLDAPLGPWAVSTTPEAPVLTLTRAHSSKHAHTWSPFPTGTCCLCCVINQTCQIDFTAPSERQEGSQPAALKRWRKPGEVSLFLLSPIFGPMESINNKRAVFIRFQGMSVHGRQNEPIFTSLDLQQSVTFVQNEKKIRFYGEMKLY